MSKHDFFRIIYNSFGNSPRYLPVDQQSDVDYVNIFMSHLDVITVASGERLLYVCIIIRRHGDRRVLFPLSVKIDEDKRSHNVVCSVNFKLKMLNSNLSRKMRFNANQLINYKCCECRYRIKCARFYPISTFATFITIS